MATHNTIIYMNHRLHEPGMEKPISIKFAGRQPIDVSSARVEGLICIKTNERGCARIKSHKVKAWIEVLHGDVRYDQ